MLFLYPFLTILLSQRAVSAPAPAVAAPGPLPLADHPDLRNLVHGISAYVKRLVGIAPRDQDYGSYGGYGKYGSYGSYADIGPGGSDIISEGDSNVNNEPQAEALETTTTRVSVLTTTVTLRSMATPSPTITAYCPMLDTTSTADVNAITCTRINNSF